MFAELYLHASPGGTFILAAKSTGKSTLGSRLLAIVDELISM